LSSIDTLLERLYDDLFCRSVQGVLEGRMLLRSDASMISYFIRPRRPRLTKTEMTRIETRGLFNEIEYLFDDVPAERRDLILAQMKAICDRLAKRDLPAQTAEPPTLIYPLY
jgi:hypothetical protein